LLVVLCVSSGASGGETVLVSLNPRLSEDGVLSTNPTAAPTLAERKKAYARCQERCLRALESAPVRVRYRYTYSPVLAVEILAPAGHDAIEALADVVRIDEDQQGRGALAESVPMIRADEVHELGFLGAGTTVAVLDSGVDTDHPDLAGALILDHAKHFLDQGEITGDTAEDGHGHGTHVTGVIASRGAVASVGVAPAAMILPIKILDDDNRGWFSDWSRGLDYALEVHEADNGIELDAINMSLASNALFPSVCDNQHFGLRDGVRAAAELGIPVFAASGNNGSITRMALPACINGAIAVGSVRDDREPEEISSFTNRNALLDILAPGERIISSGVGGGTRIINGTSQATPHCVGTACLLREIEQSLTPEEILMILKTTGVPIFDTFTNRTYPRIDAAAAVGYLLNPPIDALDCAYDPGTREVQATWDPIADEAAQGISIEVKRDGELVHESASGTDVTAFSYVSIEGGEIEVCVRVTYDDGESPAARCTVHAPFEGFRRGDCDGNSQYEVTDAVLTLLVLFVDLDLEIPCERACDSNDDESLDVSDATYLLSAMFTGGDLPPAPYPDCASDPTIGAPPLDCAEPHCP